ncbi:MAG: class I adenylate-forming enzyme family protein [Pseudomonadota bacterium]
MNLASLVRRHARGRPSRAAIEYRGERLTYADAWRAIAGGAALLAGQGVRPGDRVGLSLREHPAHVLLHYAAAALGAVVVPIDHRWSAAEKAAAVATFAPSLVLVDSDAAELDGSACVRTGEWLAPGGDESALAAGDDAALVLSMSSGTTGRPKAAVVTHAQMYERFITQWVTLGYNAGDRFVLVTPLFFGAGRSFAMSFLAAGATLVVDPPPHGSDELAGAVRDSGATATFLVPTLMRRLLELPADGVLFPGLRRLLISGEAFHPGEVAPFQQRLSPNLIGYYASSEGGGISVLQPQDFDAHGGTVGQAAFGVEIEIVDNRGRALPAGETGRLRYRGPGVTTALLGEDGQPEAGDPDGWFYPGDLAAVDADGFVSLRGRQKDVIIRGGVNVYPAEVEQVLMQHPAVGEAAVVGIADGRRGEQVVAFVVADEAVDDAGLLAHCRANLAPYKVPACLRRLAALPRAASGKVDKKALPALREAAP